MSSSELLVDAFDRVRETVHQAVDGLSAEQLAFRVDDEANSIAWLVWHLTRVQDDHIADVAGTEQVWTADSWFERFDLPFEPSATGYGHSPKEVAQVRVDSADLLTGYHDAVHQATVAYVAGLGDEDLPRVVDEAWDPPVTLAVRLVSVINDDLQHAGQAAFIRGVVERRTS
ncbi:mycothiol transferase [Actinopolymorpha rutila]|uniref:Putative damage-inducible protein DinB n=1 Tax=Actinopolymorpha rutila TaxID=446787 RepID=A0A852ZI22_9ACTN|nr:DinB family protein [Actinopolymorpha rutila]NYH92717.1 putative damage-inducible protein DinB [Actinopolymorpha rutila]